MTVEELLAKSVGHAEVAESWIDAAGREASSGGVNVSFFVQLAQLHAVLAEAYARMASTQVVNHASVNEMIGRMAPLGAAS